MAIVGVAIFVGVEFAGVAALTGVLSVEVLASLVGALDANGAAEDWVETGVTTVVGFVTLSAGFNSAYETPPAMTTPRASRAICDFIRRLCSPTLN